ncbi:MAG: hypothetical protein HRT56_04440 [Coraliomargarita sp.]|nr:hypothetical protein [Coraliomargarita sp.]
MRLKFGAVNNFVNRYHITNCDEILARKPTLVLAGSATGPNQGNVQTIISTPLSKQTTAWHT